MSIPKLSVSVPEHSLSHPEPRTERPEHAPSQPAHHNVEPILASCVARLQFPYRALPRESCFGSLTGFLPELILDPSKSMCLEFPCDELLDSRCEGGRFLGPHQIY
jgi:hypothetical protein